MPTLVVREGRSDVTSDEGMAEFLDAVPPRRTRHRRPRRPHGRRRPQRRRRGGRPPRPAHPHPGAVIVKQIPASMAKRLRLAAVPIAERGLDQTRLEDLVAATGVPRATLYCYFAGKE